MDIPTIVRDYPPNYEAIKAVFDLGTREICFTYGTILYIPSGFIPTPDLYVHEIVHVRQQGSNPKEWWERYLVDKDFRLAQEVEAYREQYRYFCATVKNRDEQARLLMAIATGLSSGVYGKMIDYPHALRVIKA